MEIAGLGELEVIREELIFSDYSADYILLGALGGFGFK